MRHFPRLAALGLSLTVLTAAPSALSDAAAQSLLERGRTAWKSGDYPRAHDVLLEARKEPYGRQPVVDFMLGTSGCRMAERRRWGHDVLDWMLYAYSLSHKSRQVVKQERNLCRNAALAELVNSDLGEIEEQRSAGMTGYGKTFYWSNREEQPVSSYPIRRKQDIPKEVFTSRLVALGDEQAAREPVAELGRDAAVLVHDRIRIFSLAGHSQEKLRTIGQTLARYMRFLDSRYEALLPAHYLTVYLVPSHHDVHELAGRLHGLDVSRATVGYAFVDDASVVAAVPDTGAGTVLHELFHLLVRTNFGDIPQWLDEGIASLYEVSSRRDDDYFGLDNWRGQVLHSLWELRPTIKQLIRSEWFLFDDPSQAVLQDQSLDQFFDSREQKKQAAMMATARYFALYLEQRGELARAYKAVRNHGLTAGGGDAPSRAVGIVEAALGRDVETLDREFVDWFQSGGPKRNRSRHRLLTKGGEIYAATVNLNVRTEPSTSAEKLLTINRGERVVVFATGGAWYELRLENGEAVYAYGQYLVPANQQ